MDKILNCLDKMFPDAHCELEYKSPYQLLVAVILSAQCTDKRVNQVCKALFEVAPTPEKMLALGEDKLKEYIHSCGFYNSKSKSIISATKDIVEKYNSELPTEMDDLIKLRGVGRKTANVVIGEIFKKPSIAVDTHVLRVSKRLGLTKINSTPEICERRLKKLVSPERQVKFHHQMIFFGRYHCKAINPNCENCELNNICKNKLKNNIINN